MVSSKRGKFASKTRPKPLRAAPCAASGPEVQKKLMPEPTDIGKTSGAIGTASYRFDSVNERSWDAVFQPGYCPQCQKACEKTDQKDTPPNHNRYHCDTCNWDFEQAKEDKG